MATVHDAVTSYGVHGDGHLKWRLPGVFEHRHTLDDRDQL